MTEAPRLHCQYVQPDMVYAGIDCTAAVAVEKLRAVMDEGMTQKLLAQEAQEAGIKTAPSPALPAYVLSCAWPDGGATLNLYCETERWSYVWDVQVRRRWLPFFMKGYSTELATASIGKLEQDIVWLSTDNLKDVLHYFRGS